MKIKRILNLKVNSYVFKLTWDKKQSGGNFDYFTRNLTIGTFHNTDQEIFMIICHELMEIACLEMSVRFNRPDCTGDYLFSYDHRQHDTISNVFAGLLSQFIV